MHTNGYGERAVGAAQAASAAKGRQLERELQRAASTPLPDDNEDADVDMAPAQEAAEEEAPAQQVWRSPYAYAQAQD